MSVTLSCKLRNFLVHLRTNDCLIEGLKTPQNEKLYYSIAAKVCSNSNVSIKMLEHF